MEIKNKEIENNIKIKLRDNNTEKVIFSIFENVAMILNTLKITKSSSVKTVKTDYLTHTTSLFILRQLLQENSKF